MLSGKFVLRIPQDLHRHLKAEAIRENCSLNHLIVAKISNPVSGLHQDIVEVIQRLWTPLGIILFGSTVKGRERESSDIDLLIIVPDKIAIERSLYSDWDRELGAKYTKYSPHFVHIAPAKQKISGLWLEAALEGLLVSESDKTVASYIADVKDQIARGVYQRKSSHGHNYWVYQGNQNAE